MLKKFRCKLENFLYDIKYKRKFDLKFDYSKYKINNRIFEKTKLKILYLSFDRGSFTQMNVLEPLKQYGDLYINEFNTNPFDKLWYKEKKLEENRNLIDYAKKTIESNKIDVIVCYLSGHTTTPYFLEQLKKFNIPIINTATDDERKFISRRGKDGYRRGLKDVCRYFNISTTTSKSAIVKYLVEGANPLYTYLGVNNEIYIKKNSSKKYDVSFIGANYGIRNKYIEFLRENGINVYTRGKGWKEGFATQEEIIDIFNQSRIVLGFATVGKNDDIYIVKGRDFEAPMCGSFYLTTYHEELNEWYNIGKEIETYKTKEELLNKIKYYLENEREREKIAHNGYVKCINNYTSKHFFDTIFSILNLGKN